MDFWDGSYNNLKVVNIFHSFYLVSNMQKEERELNENECNHKPLKNRIEKHENINEIDGQAFLPLPPRISFLYLFYFMLKI